MLETRDQRKLRNLGRKDIIQERPWSEFSWVKDSLLSLWWCRLDSWPGISECYRVRQKIKKEREEGREGGKGEGEEREREGGREGGRGGGEEREREGGRKKGRKEGRSLNRDLGSYSCSIRSKQLTSPGLTFLICKMGLISTLQLWEIEILHVKHPMGTQYTGDVIIIPLFFWLSLWHVEVSGPGMEPGQWQH